MEILHSHEKIQLLVGSSLLGLESRAVAAGDMVRPERWQVTLQTMACWVRLVGVQVVCG